MTALITAKQHFAEDIDRAEALRTHAADLPCSLIRDDIMRSAWMMGVGALDAYFCDAYADLIARTLQAKQQQPEVEIPDRLSNLRLPVIAVIRASSNEGWRWRLAARELIEDHTVLSIERIKKLFNHFFRKQYKLFGSHSFDSWLLHAEHRRRLFGIDKGEFRKTEGSQKQTARSKSIEHFEDRYQTIFQRRHDCIHNCDRPKIALDRNTIENGDSVEKILDDVRFLVNRCHEALEEEFPIYLQNLGFSGITRNRVGV